MELKIFIRQTQQQDITGNNIYFQGSNVNNLSPVIGTLPFARQWRNYGSFINVTSDSGDVYSLALEWSGQDNRDNEGFIATGTFNPRKSASGQINFDGEAYALLKQWLVDDVSAQLNSVDIEITHYDDNSQPCGTYKNWVVKASDIEWCEDGLCVFDTVFKQKDEAYNCIKSTIISDDWQGWFNDKTTKPHPRYSYCNEERPNGKLVVTWYIMGSLVFTIKLLIFTIIPILIPTLYIILGIIIVINFIIGIVGGNPIDETPIRTQISNLSNIKQFQDNIGNFYVEAAGCGREHPAPLIRDYIYNVCAKCGVEVDETTAPIFFAQQITIETNSRGVITHDNPHYRACYLYTPIMKGIRRFRNLSLFGYSEPDNSYYLAANRPLQTLDVFLDEIKGLYNAEWNIKNGVLYIQRKDFYRLPTSPYVLDLSLSGADRNRLLQGICFTWNERKIPAYVYGLYNQDGIDTCGDEAKNFMNDTYSYGNAANNPVYNGVQDKTVQFGATKFRGDGVNTDYIFDAFQSIVNSNFISGVFGGATLFNDVQPVLEQYADYALLMRDEKNALPKILIWDGIEYLNARAEKYYTGISTFGSEPPINYNYNPQLYGFAKTWSMVHVPQTFVRGSTLTFASHPIGKYRATDIFAIQSYEMIAYLINYPMYMGIGFEDSMWDWFHWIDDPNKRSVLMRTANCKIELCCDLLNRLKVFGDGSNIVLGERILLPHGEGIITNIKVDYNPDAERGQHIEIIADA